MSALPNDSSSASEGYHASQWCGISVKRCVECSPTSLISAEVVSDGWSTQNLPYCRQLELTFVWHRISSMWYANLVHFPNYGDAFKTVADGFEIPSLMSFFKAYTSITWETANNIYIYIHILWMSSLQTFSTGCCFNARVAVRYRWGFAVSVLQLKGVVET